MPRRGARVIGPNGAGKTTLFNVICGFVRADVGFVLLRGKTVERIRPDNLSGLASPARSRRRPLPADERAQNVMVGAQRFRRARLPSVLLGSVV